MTFAEWCDQTARDTKSNVTRELVREIMATALRSAVEEFLANPADATLDIFAIGRFYLNRNAYDMSKRYHLKDRTESNDIVYSWSVIFKPSTTLKKVLNNKRDIADVSFGLVKPIYKQVEIQADGTIKKKGNRNKQQLVIKKKVHMETQRELKKQIQSKLPED
jgi:hypothetical protein